MNVALPKKPRGRPPKSPRADCLDTKSALIRSGVEVLTERGYMTADIETILSRVGIPKGSFYYYFESKEAFVIEVINHYARYFAYKLDKHLLDASLSPLQRIDGFCKGAMQGMRKYQFERGCLVGNLGQEVTVLPTGYRVRLNAIIQEWQNKIANCLEQAQGAGELAVSADCVMLADFFWIGWEGAVMRAKLAKSDQPLQLFMDFFMSSLPR